MTRTHLLRTAALIVILAACFSPAAHAQYPGYLTSSNDTGMPNYGSYISSNIDSVNLTNGNLIIRIPILDTKSRGPEYKSFYEYDSKLWVVDTIVRTIFGHVPVTHFAWRIDASAGGWHYMTNIGGGVGWTEQTYNCPTWPGPLDTPGKTLVRSNYFYSSADGSRHQLPLLNVFETQPGAVCQPGIFQNPAPNQVAFTDSEHIRVDISQEQYPDTFRTQIKNVLSDGTQINFSNLPFMNKDANGNYCCGSTTTPDSLGLYWTLDTLGRPITNSAQYYDSSGNLQPMPAISSTMLNLIQSFPTTSYDTQHVVDPYNGMPKIFNAYTALTLANGLSYQFSYDDPDHPGTQNPYGEISKITLPTGGYIKYKFATFPVFDPGPTDPQFGEIYNLDSRRVVQRIVSEDGTVASEKIWTYAYTPVSTTVTDPLGNYEIHGIGPPLSCAGSSFIASAPAANIDGGASYYDATGKLLKTVATNFQCDGGPIYVAQPGMNIPKTSYYTVGLRNIRPIATVTTLGDTNQVSETDTVYGDCFNYTYVADQQRTDCRDNPTQILEYDYGNGVKGNLLRSTSYSYYHNLPGNSAYLTANIVRLVAQKTVFDGGGNQIASTQYDYDKTAITSTNSTVPQHDDANFPSSFTVRGNVTHVMRWLSTTGGTLTTTNYYNDVGNLVQTSDPLNHTYNLSYADNFTDSSKNGNTQGFLTSVTSPTTANTVPHVEGKQYFWFTGLTAAVCGQNAPNPAVCTNSLTPSQSAPVADYAKYTYDLLRRPLTVTHGDGGLTNFAFHESSLPLSVSSSSAIDPSQNLVNTALIDGLGRVKETQLNSDPDGVAYVDTTYDPAGQKSTVSNPHRSSTGTTDGITTYQYDGLGRTTVVILPDGTTTSNNLQTFYRGNSVTVVDQAGKARRSYTDALGRLIEVDEPAAGSALPGIPATHAIGVMMIGGFDQSISQNVDTGQQQCTLYDCGGSCIQWQEIYQWQSVYDSGTVSVTVNGRSYSVNYGPSSTPANLATSLAASITADSASSVTASASSGAMTITAKTIGYAGNSGQVSVSVVSNSPGQFPVSFSASDPLLAGGVDAIGSFPPGETAGTPYVTLYTYDALDNLTCVEQHGTATGQTGCSAPPSNDATSTWRIRRFKYDSLGRLTKATNPESGTICYGTVSSGTCQENGYDLDGNLVYRTDARGILTTMTYDQLHRVLTKTYSGETGTATPTGTYIYDVAATDGPGSSANPIGHLVEVKNSNAKEVDSYDSRGRIAAQWQCTPLNCGSSWFNLTYSYNYAGGLISESTPMGFTLTPAYDPAARLKSLSSSWSDAQHPANLLTVDATAGYTPAGALAKMTYGNGLIETSVYNNRLQPVQLDTCGMQLLGGGDANPTYTCVDVLNLSYGYADTHGNNNGNVVTFNSTATQIFMRTYTYDELNRLSTMSSPTDASGCYGLAWTYDAWGNRLSQSATGGSGSSCAQPSPTVYTNNRFVDPVYSYDAAGNMTHDASHGYAYDAENRLTTMDGTGATYVYDASGQRVRKIVSGVATDYVYGVSGDVVSEIQGATWTKGYAYAGRGLVAQYNGALGAPRASTVFVHKDHLGSTRVVTSVAAAVSDSMDYLPYGEQIAGNYGTSHKFTGQERDTESGLDNFGARYMASTLGRFASADPMMNSGRPENPQTWNRYTYTMNNPLNFTDPTGLYTWSAALGGNKEDSEVSTDVHTKREHFRLALVDATLDADNLTDFDQWADAMMALDSYGYETQPGVVIALDTIPGDTGAFTAVQPDNQIVVAFSATQFESRALEETVAHEGKHTADAKAWIKCGRCDAKNPSTFEEETAGYEIAGLIAAAHFIGTGKNDFYGVYAGPTHRGMVIWNTSWGMVDWSRSLIRKAAQDVVRENGEGPETDAGKKKAFPGGGGQWQ